ncbi:hypothetical protein L484_018317 [Morus notabilis]|uniref:DUF4216 domain-containing protein n=1 Tax=Morus notabilis TaxID=981085 RepID=W9R2C8_9ROSA|nr:hypothetical protein L484_018317 [Morus notabilis]
MVLFKCTWYKTDGRNNIYQEFHITSVNVSLKWYQDQPFILANQVNQVFYLHDDKLGSDWKVVKKDIPKVTPENAHESKEDADFSSEAYQEERSNEINVTFDESNIEAPLNCEDVRMTEIDSLVVELPIDLDNDQIQHELDTNEDSYQELDSANSVESNDIVKDISDDDDDESD